MIRFVKTALFTIACVIGGSAAGSAATISELAAWRLSEKGVGPIKVGMTVAEASAASGMKLTDTGNYEGDCRTYALDGVRQLGLMVERGRISTVGIYDDFTATRSIISTSSGLRLGDPIAKLKAAHPDLRAETDPNGGTKYYKWLPGRKFGLRFDVSDGRIVGVDGGNQSITYSESCS